MRVFNVDNFFVFKKKEVTVIGNNHSPVAMPCFP